MATTHDHHATLCPECDTFHSPAEHPATEEAPASRLDLKMDVRGDIELIALERDGDGDWNEEAADDLGHVAGRDTFEKIKRGFPSLLGRLEDLRGEWEAGADARAEEREERRRAAADAAWSDDMDWLSSRGL